MRYIPQVSVTTLQRKPEIRYLKQGGLMSEEVKKDVKDQVAVAPETTQGQNEPQVQVSPSEPQKGSKEYNFAQLRQKNEELERRVNELVRKEQEKNAPQPQIEEQLFDDDILTVKQADKRAEKIAQEIVNKVLVERERAKLPEQTRTKFNDFDEIMTEENIKKLEIDEPGLADACTKASNPWEATYKILKKFVLPQQEVKNTKSDEKMKENLSKPVSVNSVGRGPLQNANIWSEASKDDLYKEMIKAARG